MALSSVVALLLAEVGMRFAVNPADFLQAKMLEDAVLNHRIAPFTTGHDALGFRNADVPERAHIVAIGDSLTYGVGAPREASWPHQLGMLLGTSVYNMGLGGYGPLQYLYLAQNAAKPLKPRFVVVGFYLGNDLMDAFYLARGRPHWYGWRVSTEAEPSLTDLDRAGQAQPKKRFATLRDWLARNSVLYSVVRATILPRFQIREQEALAAQADPDVRMLWIDASEPTMRTIFTPQLRLSAVDLDIRAVREGMTISQKALVALKAEVDRQGAQLLTVIIPTKERVYCRHLEESRQKTPEAFVNLCRAEVRANAELSRFLAKHGIAYVDVTRALESHIERRLPVYPNDSDAHPQAAGYKVIAHEIAAGLRRHFPEQLGPERPREKTYPAGPGAAR
jgi:lysophospholipase L1-like esterase